MRQARLFYGTLFIIAVILLIWLDGRLSASFSSSEGGVSAVIGLRRCDGLLVTAVVVVLVVGASRELHRLLVLTGRSPLLTWPTIVSVAMVLVPFAAAALAETRRAADLTDHRLTVLLAAMALPGAAMLIGRRRKASGAIGDIAATLFMVLYLGLLPQYLIRLRLADSAGGGWLLLYVIGAVKICDIGAYFTGMALGRTKLIPWLSPGKTWEGLVGGVICSMLLAGLVPVAVRAWASPEAAVLGLLPTGPQACLFGLLMGLVGQAGDLLESLIKRDAQAKDSANAVPAFGGLLDILDSPLLAAPLAYWMLLE